MISLSYERENWGPGRLNNLFGKIHIEYSEFTACTLTPRVDEGRDRMHGQGPAQGPKLKFLEMVIVAAAVISTSYPASSCLCLA